MKKPSPNFRTDPENYSKVEKAKLNSNGLRGNLHQEIRDLSFQNISWEAEQIAKSHGIYLEYNRAKTGNQKDWMYMLRISIPGGGPLTKGQWNILDRVADSYTIGPEDAHPNASPSLRVTTRQNIQLHWVRKEKVVRAIQDIAESGFFTINGCGDNTRNVMACPLSKYSSIFNANEWAQKVGKYFTLPTAAYIEVFQIDSKYLRKASLTDREPGKTRFAYGPNLLNRKFKIGFSAIHYDDEGRKYVPDNCIELRTNDIGVAPIIESDGKVNSFQVYVGGGQGEDSGKLTYAVMGEPFGVFAIDDLLKGLDAIASVHQEWGDRQNRHWARLKYLVKIKGVEWLREQVRIYDSVVFSAPLDNFDCGSRDLHLGWKKQDGNNDLWCYGAFIENGRIIDGSPNGDIKKMVSYLMNDYEDIELLTTPNQHLIFANISEEKKDQFENDMRKFGYGVRKHNGVTKPYSKLRVLSGACVGRDTCRLTYTDSEKFEPYLIDALEEKWGGMNESIGVTGCEKQCYRPSTKTIGWVGSGFNLYQLRLFGTEDGRNQGEPLIDPDTEEQYLRFVPRKEVAKVTDVLFDYYWQNKSDAESKDGEMGYFLRRMGTKRIIDYLKAHESTAELMKRKVKIP